MRTTPYTPSDDDDAQRASAKAAALASSDKGSTRRVSLAVFGEVAAALGLEDEAARSWAEDVLARATRTVGNPDAYIRRSIAAELAQQKKAKATAKPRKSAAKRPRRNTKRTAAKKKPAESELLEVASCNETGCDFTATGATLPEAYAKVDAHAAKHVCVCKDCGQNYLRFDWFQHGVGKCKPRDAAPVVPQPRPALQPILCQHCGQSYYPEWSGEHHNGKCVQPVVPYPVAPIPHRPDQW